MSHNPKDIIRAQRKKASRLTLGLIQITKQVYKYNNDNNNTYLMATVPGQNV